MKDPLTKQELEWLPHDLYESIKSAPLLLPDRETLLGLIAASLVIVVDPWSVPSRAEFRLYLQDALHPLGLTVNRKRMRAKKKRSNPQL
jgi:hypothetical protein